MTRARDLARYNDFSGTELILDADGDTSITADTDDTIHFKIAGSDKFTLDPSGNMSISGTVPSAQLTGALPAIDGSSLTGINTDLVSDTSPQLGGNLDSNGRNITLGDSGSSNDDLSLIHISEPTRRS